MLINHWYWRVSVTSPKAQFWDHCLLFKALIILIAAFLKHGDLICCLGKPRTLRCLSQWLNSNSNSTTQFCQILKFKKNHNKLSLCSSCFFFQAQNIHTIIIRGVFYILAPVGLFKFKQLDVPFEKLGKRTSFLCSEWLERAGEWVCWKLISICCCDEWKSIWGNLQQRDRTSQEQGGFAIKSMLLHTVCWSVYMLRQHCNTVSK